MRPRSPAATRRAPARASARIATRSTRRTTASGSRRSAAPAAGMSAAASAAAPAKSTAFMVLLGAEATQRIGLEVGKLAAHAEDRRGLVLEARERERVGARVEVVEGHARAPGNVHVVVLHAVRLLEPPQLPARVVE